MCTWSAETYCRHDFSSSSTRTVSIQEANENAGSAALSTIFRLLSISDVCCCVFRPKMSKALRLNLFNLQGYIRKIEMNNYSTSASALLAPLARYGLQKFVVVGSQRPRLHDASVKEHCRKEGIEIEHEIRYTRQHSPFLPNAAEYLQTNQR